MSAISFKFFRRAKLGRIALKLVGKCEGYDPWRCAIDVASTKTTLSAACTAPDRRRHRQRCRRRYCLTNTFAKDCFSYHTLTMSVFCRSRVFVVCALGINSDGYMKNKVGELLLNLIDFDFDTDKNLIRIHSSFDFTISM